MLTPHLTSCCPTTAPPPHRDMGDLGYPLPPPEDGVPPDPTLRHSPGKAPPEDEEWDSISRVAAACSGVLEALAREGQQLRDPLGPTATPALSPSGAEDEPRTLSEKVSQLEVMLKQLRGELQEEQEAKARLRAELRTLRRSNRRLQREHEDAAARLRRVTQLLHEDPPASPPDTPPGTPPP